MIPGEQGNRASDAPAVSENGMIVAFQSAASNLVAGDSNGRTDIFVKNFQTGETILVSGGPGVVANGDSARPMISQDGRFVVFESGASNLVAGDTNGRSDIFIKDLLTGELERVSVNTGGAQGNSHSNNAWVSGDGNLVVFHSTASNLVAGDTNNESDIFLHDRTTGVTTRINLGPNGEQAGGGLTPDGSKSHQPTISEDGRYITYKSWATNLVDGDTNRHSDVFLYDRVTGETTRINTDSDGDQVDREGRKPFYVIDDTWVVMEGDGTNYVPGDTNNRWDVFVKNLVTGETTRVSTADGTNAQGNGTSLNATMSADGTLVAFRSGATNLVDDDTNGRLDIFVKNLVTDETIRVSESSTGGQANGDSFISYISEDGRYVTFASDASNLVAGDTNNARDVFRKDLTTGEVELVSRAADTPEPDDTQDVRVSFVSEGAWWNNTFGWYDRASGEAGIIIVNTDTSAATGFQRTLEIPDTAGFFLVPNGFNLNFAAGRQFAGVDVASVDWRIVERSGEFQIVDAASGRAIVGKFGDFAPVGGAWFTDETMNRDGRDHVRESADGTQRWEDRTNLGDANFSDFVVDVDILVA